MPQRDIIVIGTSLGGIEALKTLVHGLPADLPAAVFVVLHMGAYSPGILPEVLQPVSALPVANAHDRDRIEPGHIYVAPPDHHLVLERSGVMRTTRGPRENRSRPAVDPLFRSAAAACGPRAIGVILTGMLDDGTAGLWAVRERGGVAIVQNPEEALAPDMPLNALKHVDVQHCVSLEKIAPLLIELTRAPAELPASATPEPAMETEVKIALEENAQESGVRQLGEPSLYACPECHGVLLQIKEGSNVRFRCHTGHAYSVNSLLSEFHEKNEEALWNAIRSIDESVMLMRTMAKQLSAHQHNEAAAALQQEADDAQSRSELLRQSLLQATESAKTRQRQGRSAD